MRKAPKALIRQAYLSKRDKLGVSLRKSKSRLIHDKLLSLEEFQAAKTCLIYASFRSEVETDSMITDSLTLGKRLALPIIDIKTKRLLIGEVKNGLEDLRISTYGIREPIFREDTLMPSEEVDIFIVPGVAFDITGTRLGYGGGFYDRLLNDQHLQLKPIIGLAYEVQIGEEIPFEEYDIKMKKILTEERIIDCI